MEYEIWIIFGCDSDSEIDLQATKSANVTWHFDHFAYLLRIPLSRDYNFTAQFGHTFEFFNLKVYELFNRFYIVFFLRMFLEL